ncbi:hypothetical protein L3X38_032662 [Prunus dulcis]|uniref:Retrotransposon Copia-like N-terminal domain-containing protein n=1 Tax=Prunus dulcis TaxID=3755 RepID=A0AAD4YW51_PRUDU|nr:uncharacterized protein LOC117612498 [Prunus dulcis]KAI5323590.1 hypothetical protein L3X38_032662 [Prunus dulcis]
MDIVPSSKTSDTTPPSSQIVTIHSDNTPFPTGIILTKANYALWSQVMEMRIVAREKLGYLTGDAPQPSKLSSTYNKWCIENFRVKGWFIDSMSPDLMGRFIRLSTAKELRDAVKKTYFDGGDETSLFDLKKRAFTIKQNGPFSTNTTASCRPSFRRLITALQIACTVTPM